jgi:hypothetical protein
MLFATITSFQRFISARTFTRVSQMSNERSLSRRLEENASSSSPPAQEEKKKKPRVVVKSTPFPPRSKELTCVIVAIQGPLICPGVVCAWQKYAALFNAENGISNYEVRVHYLPDKDLIANLRDLSILDWSSDDVLVTVPGCSVPIRSLKEFVAIVCKNEVTMELCTQWSSCLDRFYPAFRDFIKNEASIEMKPRGLLHGVESFFAMPVGVAQGVLCDEKWNNIEDKRSEDKGHLEWYMPPVNQFVPHNKFAAQFIRVKGRNKTTKSYKGASLKLRPSMTGTEPGQIARYANQHIIAEYCQYKSRTGLTFPTLTGAVSFRDPEGHHVQTKLCEALTDQTTVHGQESCLAFAGVTANVFTNEYDSLVSDYLQPMWLGK